MKWNELQEKQQVKLLVDLRLINASKTTQYCYVTPAELDDIAPVVHKAGSVFTIYPADAAAADIELFNEQTDDVLFMDPFTTIPCYFEVL